MTIKLIFELIIGFLNVVYIIIKLFAGWSIIEQQRANERLQTVIKALQDMIDNKADIVNEDNFLNQLEWEKKERYAAYKPAILSILSQGRGIEEMKKEISMAMNLRVIAHEKEIIALLQDINTPEEKAVKIAKLLVTA